MTATVKIMIKKKDNEKDLLFDEKIPTKESSPMALRLSIYVSKEKSRADSTIRKDW